MELNSIINTFDGVVVSNLDSQNSTNEFESHLVPHLSKKLHKLLIIPIHNMNPLHIYIFYSFLKSFVAVRGTIRSNKNSFFNRSICFGDNTLNGIPLIVLPLRVGVNLGVIARKVYATLTRSIEAEFHHQMQFSVISTHHFLGGVEGLMFYRRYNQPRLNPFDGLGFF